MSENNKTIEEYIEHLLKTRPDLAEETARELAIVREVEMALKEESPEREEVVN